MNISLKLRKILAVKEAHDILRQLYEHKEEKGRIEVFLPLVTKCVDTFFKEAETNEERRNIPDRCYDQPDENLILDLESSGVVKVMERSVNDNKDFFFALLSISDPEYIKELYLWIPDSKYLVNYGDFSLNRLNGDCLYKDHMTRLNPGSAQFKVFEKLINNGLRGVTYEEILQIKGDSMDESVSRTNRDSYVSPARDIVKHIRSKLKITNQELPPIQPTDDGYTLLPA